MCGSLADKEEQVEVLGDREGEQTTGSLCLGKGLWAGSAQLVLWHTCIKTTRNRKRLIDDNCSSKELSKELKVFNRL